MKNYVIHLSKVFGATSQNGRGIEYDALRECAGTLCVADLQSQLDRLTIFRLDTSLLESLVSSSLTGSHIEILRTEY